MPFHDLHVAYTSNDAELQATLDFLGELDYTVVALTVTITSKLPAQLPPIHLERLRIPPQLQVLKRLTLTISDNAQNHRINTLTSTPTNEKAFQLCCSSLECDIISLDFTQRIGFPIKFKTVASALQRGVRLEICYSLGITGSNDARRNLISGAASLIRATRGRGIILSSEARNALGLRGPWDLINLAEVWGLSQERGKEAVCEEAARVVRLAGIKRSSFRGVVDIVDDGSKEITVEPATAKGDGESSAQPSATDSPLPLPQVTVVPDKKVNLEKAKRKASITSLNDKPQAKSLNEDGKQISRREQKRQAKKAKLDRAAGLDKAQQEAAKEQPKSKSSGFQIQHEALAMKKR
ncbi:RNA-binding RNA processing protein rpp1 [Lithohypha guttulata]|uniref:RNA-binding RNA processing protein rpp1 n=1 Tax=Lithohypha guttulata TaxID=1690604 RepID=A0ABR0K014_9EURO|nr:RNA-binding RNA processing protein rpp1 [Lithohypha guttulata]